LTPLHISEALREFSAGRKYHHICTHKQQTHLVQNTALF